MKTTAIIFLSIFLASCATFHSGTLTGNVFPNQKIVDFAIGTEKATYVLGIGGNKKDALVYNAKRNLYNSFPLKENQAYSNFTIDFKNSFKLVYFERKVIITADIVEVNSSFKVVDGNLEKNEKNYVNSGFFKVNDKVLASTKMWDYELARVIGFSTKGLEIQFTGDSENLTTKFVTEDKIFLTEDRGTKNKFLGKSFVFSKKSTDNTNSAFEGNVVGIGINSLLLEYQNDGKTEFYEIKYDK